MTATPAVGGETLSLLTGAIGAYAANATLATRGAQSIQISLTWRDESSDRRPVLVHGAGFSPRYKENLTPAMRTIANVKLSAHCH